jgi:hypothetical protein
LNFELRTTPASLPLTDGTLCRITEPALWLLEDHFGIHSGRVRKGAGGHADVVVKPSPAKYPDATEVPLRDLLAVFSYRMAGDAEPGDKWRCLDGDCRNLLPSNIVIEKAAPKKIVRSSPRKFAAKTEHAPSALSKERQLELLSQAISGHTYKQLLPDGTPEEIRIKPLAHIGFAMLWNKPLVGEVLGGIVLDLVEQINAGKFRGNCDAQFFGWVRQVARNQFHERLAGLLKGCVSDMEHDRAAIRLRKVLQQEADEAGSPHFVSQFAYSRERADVGRKMVRAERAAKKAQEAERLAALAAA